MIDFSGTSTSSLQVSNEYGFANSLSLNSLRFHTLNLLQISQMDQQLELTSLVPSSLGHETYAVNHFSFIFLIINKLNISIIYNNLNIFFYIFSKIIIINNFLKIYFY